MFNSVFFKELGVKYPIIQGGMAWVADSSLASAVSNAGGLGIIAAANAPALTKFLKWVTGDRIVLAIWEVALGYSTKLL